MWIKRLYLGSRKQAGQVNMPDNRIDKPRLIMHSTTKKLTKQYCGRKNVTWHWYCTLIGHYQIQVMSYLLCLQTTSSLVFSVYQFKTLFFRGGQIFFSPILLKSRDTIKSLALVLASISWAACSRGHCIAGFETCISASEQNWRK